MTNEQLLQTVYMHLGGRQDGVLAEPLILAKAKDAIRMLTKETVLTNSPFANSLIKRFRTALTMESAQVSAGNDTFYCQNHGLSTGDSGTFASAVETGSLDVPALPAGLSEGTTYYAIVVDEDTFKVATSLVNAQANTPVNLTDTGTGYHTFSLSDPDINLRTTPTDIGFYYFETDGLELVFGNGRLVRLSVADGTGAEKILEPIHSWTALSVMPDRHCVGYYKWQGNRVYVSLKTGADYSGGFRLEHHVYMTVAEFPFELIDLLLTKLLPMLAPPMEPEK